MYRVTETKFIMDFGKDVITTDYRWLFLAKLHVWLDKMADECILTESTYTIEEVK